MFKADFSNKMYLQLSHAVCLRIAFLTDLLTVNSFIMPVYESNNNEMKHNHDMLIKHFGHML